MLRARKQQVPATPLLLLARGAADRAALATHAAAAFAAATLALASAPLASTALATTVAAAAALLQPAAAKAQHDAHAKAAHGVVRDARYPFSCLVYRPLRGDPDPTGEKVAILQRTLAEREHIQAFFWECVSGFESLARVSHSRILASSCY